MPGSRGRSGPKSLAAGWNTGTGREPAVFPPLKSVYDTDIQRFGLSLVILTLLVAHDQARAGTLTVTFDTTPAGGRFAPRNVVAVWVETSTRRYIKTLGRWSAERTLSLIGWAMASNSDLDVVSGATRLDHSERLQVVWDTADADGELVVAGGYRIRMELSDDNAGTPDVNNQGAFPFSIDGVARVETPDDNGGFTNVVIDYTGGPVGERDPNDPGPDPEPDPDSDAGPDSGTPEIGGGCGVGGGGGLAALLLVVVALVWVRRERGRGPRA